jgi:hypothetical protein
MNPDTSAAPARRLLALGLVVALLAPTALAVGKNKAKYLGGTINSVAVSTTRS